MERLNIEGCDPFVTKELSKDVYRWTLASLLRTMLQSAEELFGERNRDFTILGVDFEESGPNIFFSGGYDSKDIIIRLGLNAQTDMYQACYQMAHETVHLLAPVEKERGNNLEEGVAEYFANLYMKESLNQPGWQSNLPSYRRALDIVRPHLDADIDLVRRLRSKQRVFAEMSPDLLKSECPNLTPGNVEFLLDKFCRTAK